VAFPVVDTPAVAAAADGLPGWDIRRAEQVICWGARLAELGLASEESSEADSVMREAGLFNLAVACFDTVVDEMPGQLLPLARALHPSLLARRLDGAAGSRLTTGRSDGPAEAIVQLFEASLGSTSSRLADQPQQRRQLAELLRRMYDSETGRGPNPFLAKTLPVVYIGEIANIHGTDPSRARAAGALFSELARFIADWDDYQDLADDWTHGRTNRFLRTLPTPQHVAPVMSFGEGLARLLFARRSRTQLAKALLESLDSVRYAAVAAERAEETARLLARLVSGGP
jgi:hypothetical protein